ncbi:MAG: phage tail sheath subtilisin-like domain-containing protein [Sporomusaceae bacterium]|nr:phage tail sheath subtilisin-like domain-containing protein [Sporomusaceae bacterium]
MALEFIVPGMQIDESDVGTRPTEQLSLSRIGIVGTFQKGLVNTPTTIGDETQFAKVFGVDKPGLTGPKTVKGCLAQGANDLSIVRIIGDGAAAAELILEDEDANSSIQVKATSPGIWGNDLKVTVAINSPAVDITVTDGDSIDFFRAVDLNKLPLTKNLVTLSKAAGTVGAVNLPKAVDKVSLSGGNDGAAVTDTEYIGTITPSGKRSGLKALEPVQCGLAVCAQQYSANIHHALITWAENCSVDEGLRIPVLSAPPGFGVDAACVQTQMLDTPSGRGVFAYPWVTPEDELDDEVFVSPDGYYAGRLAVLNPHQSPSNKPILGIRKLEGDYVYANVKALTQARISPITLVRGRGFRIRNGVTLSSDTAWNQINIRRQQDKMEMDLYHSMQWAISEDHDKPLWEAITTQADAYLQVQTNLGFIKGFLPTLCNEQTNPPENIINRILIFVIRWKPLYAADFIIMKMKRELPTSDTNAN